MLVKNNKKISLDLACMPPSNRTAGVPGPAQVSILYCIYIYSVCSGAGFLYEDSDIVGTGLDPAPYLNADQDPWL